MMAPTNEWGLFLLRGSLLLFALMYLLLGLVQLVAGSSNHLNRDVVSVGTEDLARRSMTHTRKSGGGATDPR